LCNILGYYNYSSPLFKAN